MQLKFIMKGVTEFTVWQLAETVKLSEFGIFESEKFFVTPVTENEIIGYIRDQKMQQSLLVLKRKF